MMNKPKLNIFFIKEKNIYIPQTKTKIILIL